MCGRGASRCDRRPIHRRSAPPASEELREATLAKAVRCRGCPLLAGCGALRVRDRARRATADLGLAFLDELRAQRYPVPRVTALFAMADHGVDLEYLQGLGALGYRLGTLADLIRAREHGVDPAYIRGLEAAGYHHVPLEELLRARDHGVDAGYISGMASAGFKGVALTRLVAARDHGVDP